MPSPNPPAPATQPGYELYERLTAFGDAPVALDARRRLLDRFLSLRSGREKPGRFWRVDLEAMVPSAATIETGAGTSVAFRRSGRARLRSRDGRPRVPGAASRARSARPASRDSKFGALATRLRAATARSSTCRADHASDEPIVIRHTTPRRTRRSFRTPSCSPSAERASPSSSASPPKPARSSAAPRRSSPKTHADVTYASVQSRRRFGAHRHHARRAPGPRRARRVGLRRARRRRSPPATSPSSIDAPGVAVAHRPRCSSRAARSTSTS